MPFAADVIIIGSGPAGVSAAWPLVESGARVLMLDASGGAALPPPPSQPTINAWRASTDRLHDELGASGPLGSALRSPKFATPLGQAILAGFEDAVRLRTEGYFAVGSLASGGLSRLWGALATEFSDADLAGWGDAGGAMAASYARVRARIGTSAPSVLSPSVDRLWRAKNKARGFTLDLASNAVLAAPREGRDACNACGLCLQGCARGSIYHGAQDLQALRRHGNFAYRPGVRVTELASEAGLHRVTGRSAGETVHFAAPAVILAAGTLMTTRLALRRLGLWGQPVRIESNPVGGTAFVVPSLIGSAAPDRTFGLGQLFYTIVPEPGVEAAGVFYGAETLALASVAERLPLTRGAAMRLAHALMPALVLATGYLPGRFSDNSLTLEEDGAEGRLVIRGRQDKPVEAMLRRSFRGLGRQLRPLGGWQLPSATHVLEPGSDAHPGATLPMGGSGPAATDRQGELAGVRGLYVVDGAALPTLSARHPTLTIMANADRIGRALAQKIAAKPMVAAGAH